VVKGVTLIYVQHSMIPLLLSNVLPKLITAIKKEKTNMFIYGLLLLFFISEIPAQNLIELRFYDITVHVYTNSDSIEVELLLDCFVKKESGKVQFVFSDKLNINSLNIKINEEWYPLNFEFNGADSLLVNYSKGLSEGMNFILKFNYSFPAGSLNDTMIYLDRGHRWYPIIMDQVVPFKLTCNVPSEYAVLAAGNLAAVIKEGENSNYIWESAVPVFKLPLIIFNPDAYKKVSIGIADLYYSDLNSAEAENILNEVNNIVEYCNESIGTYSYDKITLFEIDEFTGINTCSGLLMTGFQPLQAAGKGYNSMLLLTLAQQWFGAGVFGKFGEEGFFLLTFSLPHYLRLMYERSEYGDERFDKALMEPLEGYKKFAGTDKDIPITKIDAPDTREKAIILYAKGPYILNLIENSIGRDEWKDMLKQLYEENQGKVINLDTFKKYLDEYDTDGSTLILFNKLLNEKDLPDNY
jgi:hypothetical protein